MTSARTRTLTDRELTLATLARQGLLARWRTSAAQAVRRLVALQSQYSPSPYLALHTRVEGFAIVDLERALRRGTVVKSTLMRGTLHLVHADDYPAYASAWRWQARRMLAGRERALEPRSAEVIAALEPWLAEPRTTDEIRARVRELTGDCLRYDHDALDYARDALPLVHVPPSGLWRRHGRFSLVRWAGEPVADDPAAGTVELVRAYLAAFGPATREDLAAFTWLRFGQLDPALAALSPRRLTDARGRELFDLPRAPLPREQEAAPPPVRFLPKWDALLLSHRDRTRVLPPGFQDAVYASRTADVASTFLVDGQVAGTWRSSEDDARAVLHVRSLIGRDQLPSSLEPEALRLLALLHPDAERYEVVPED